MDRLWYALESMRWWDSSNFLVRDGWVDLGDVKWEAGAAVIYPRMPEEDGLDKFTRREVRRAATQLMWARNDFRIGFAAIMIGYVLLYLLLASSFQGHWSWYFILFGQPCLILGTNYIFKGWYRRSFLEALGRRTNSVCVSCGYPTGTLPRHVRVCPECGTSFDHLNEKNCRKRLPFFFRLMPRNGRAADLDDRLWLEIAGEAVRRLYSSRIVIVSYTVVALGSALLMWRLLARNLPATVFVTVLGIFALLFLIAFHLIPRQFSKQWQQIVEEVIAERCGERCPKCRQDLRGLPDDQANCPECGLMRGRLRLSASGLEEQAEVPL